jgi:hypothetical protein
MSQIFNIPNLFKNDKYIPNVGNPRYSPNEYLYTDDKGRKIYNRDIVDVDDLGYRTTKYDVEDNKESTRKYALDKWVKEPWDNEYRRGGKRRKTRKSRKSRKSRKTRRR